MSNDHHLIAPAALLARRHSDAPITEDEFAAIGRAAHKELLAIISRKQRQQREDRQEHRHQQQQQPGHQPHD